MKKRILTLVISIIAMLTCVFGLVACNKDDNSGNSSSGKRQVPVYQGMTISNSQSTVLTANSMSINLMSAKTPGNTDNNGNHNGWYKGDHNGKDEDIDQKNPFPENGKNENIETEIESTLDVIGAEQEIYYAKANEDIYINIHISNPDNYEIMSFTLNDKKYSSYMFEEGSDMETLVLKYNVGSESGIQEYTIDAIKYIDGTDIKDVIMDGDKTVLAGVRIENQVNATISNATIQTNMLSFNVKINDNDNLISYSQGCLKAVVYDGESVVATKDLTVGDNNVSFDNLATSTLYQYAIVGYYDDLSGEGFAMNTLYKEAFYTKAIVLFDNVIVSQENIEFSFVWDSEFQNKTLTALKLYKGNTLTELSSTSTTVNNLLSNTIYTLIAEYKNGEKTENISLEFKTEAKAVPVVEIANPTKTQTIVGFAINETDADNVGAVTKIELIHANRTVVADSLDVREFTGLLSNNTYTVKVTYAYDLNDGVGSQEIVKTLDIKTEAKAVPTILLDSNSSDKASITYSVKVIDADEILNNYIVELLKNGEVIKNNGTTQLGTFSDLISNNDYVIRVSYSYNLNNGCGSITDSISKSVMEINLETNDGNEPTKVFVINGGSLPVATRSGFTFGGWSLSADLNVIVDVAVDANSTYYAYWKEETKPSYFKYAGSTRITITGNNGNLPSDIWIPSYIGGKPVYKIASKSFDGSNIRKVVIGGGIAVVEEYAFNFCTNLMSVTIPSSVTTLGDSSSSTFNGCIHLMEIYNLSNSYDLMFKYVPGLYTDLNEKSKITKDKDGYYFFENKEESYLFAYEGGKSEITLPSSSPAGKKYKIYDDAFSWGCVRLTKVIISEGVTEIGEYAFMMSGVKEIYISKTVVKIGQGAFSRNYSSLENITFENPLNWVSVYDSTETTLDLSDSYENALLFRSDESGRWWHC